MRSARVAVVAAGGALAASVLMALPGGSAAAVTVSPHEVVSHSQLVSAVPVVKKFPNILDGAVHAVVQVGNGMLVGGSFTQMTPYSGGVAQPTRNIGNLVAFDATTGVIQSGQTAIDGEVDALIPGPTAGTAYVGGQFTNVNGVKSKSLALITVATGQTVATFKTPALNGVVRSLSLSGNRLYVGGTFTTAAGLPHGGVVALDANTGAIDPFLNLQESGHHNFNGTGANGAVGTIKLAVSPDGTTLIIIGNFKNVADSPSATPVLRDQIVKVLLTGSVAAIDPNWSTAAYSARCLSNAYDTYMRGLAWAPDGSYFVVAATGGWDTRVYDLCDTAARWDAAAQGSNLLPAWADYTGGDTLHSTTVTGASVYVGGHQRWLNNPTVNDKAGPGAVPRPGLGALDSTGGVPMAWNPGRNPRGAGTYVLYATNAGLWEGSDTAVIGNGKYNTGRVAFFPLAGGYTPPTIATPTLPGTVYLGGTGGGSDAVRAVDVNGSGVPTGPVRTLTSTGGTAWHTARGAAMIGNQLFYGLAPGSTGSFHVRTFDGATFGPDTTIDPYNDPVWAGVDTGSGNTYDGKFPDFYPEIPKVTSLFFANGKLYETQSSTSTLVYHYVDVDSGVVSEDEFTSPGSFNWSVVKGAFLTGNTLYYANSGDGHLYKVGFSGDQATGPPTLVDASLDWRTQAMFLGGPSTPVPPTAVFTAPTCTQSVACGFNGTSSHDGAGNPVASYAWTFADGGTATGPTPSHTFATTGQFDVTLMVTDSFGQQGSVTHPVTVVPATTTAIAFVGRSHFIGNTTQGSVVVPAGTVSGDTLLLFAGVNSTAGTLGPPGGVTGWTQVGATQNNGTAMTTAVWFKVATASDLGKTVSLPWSSSAVQTNLELLDYTGTNPTTPIAASGFAMDTVTTASHTTPTVSGLTGTTDWGVSYWSDKSSSTTSWTAPSGVVTRDTQVSTSGGRITDLVADSGGGISTASYGGLTATTDQPGTKAISATIVLRP